MNVLVTMPDDPLREEFFPPGLQEYLESLGDVEWNPTESQFTEAELADRLAGVEVCITGWGSPQLTEDVIAAADDLTLLAHTGGSTAPVATEAVYGRGISVVSANDVMAKFTAEHVFGAIVAQRRCIPGLDASMKRGEWDRDPFAIASLHDTTIGLVGLGTIGRSLLDHLRSFDVTVRVYDPYVDEAVFEGYPFVERADLETTLSTADVVSIHASRTPETVGMLDADRLGLLRDGALLVNTARPDLVVEDALLAELRSGRIDAVLDVFHEEPLPENHELRSFDNVLLTPHVGGSQILPPLARAVVEDVERHQTGEALENEITRSQWELMTH